MNSLIAYDAIQNVQQNLSTVKHFNSKTSYLRNEIYKTNSINIFKSIKTMTQLHSTIHKWKPPARRLIITTRSLMKFIELNRSTRNLFEMGTAM